LDLCDTTFYSRNQLLIKKAGVFVTVGDIHP
jgi:hypothetical protein